jgi:hypothetical protein
MLDALPFPGFQSLAAIHTLRTLTIWTESNVGKLELQALIEREPQDLQVVHLYGCPCSYTGDPYCCRDRVKDQLRDCRFLLYVEEHQLIETVCDHCQPLLAGT